MGRKIKELSFHELNRMYKRGYPVAKIAKLFNVSLSKIYSELERTGIKPGSKTVDTQKELCNKCMYRGRISGSYTRCCNYILVTKQSRGCKARHCFRFKEGEQIRLEED